MRAKKKRTCVFIEPFLPCSDVLCYCHSSEVGCFKDNRRTYAVHALLPALCLSKFSKGVAFCCKSNTCGSPSGTLLSEMFRSPLQRVILLLPEGWSDRGVTEGRFWRSSETSLGCTAIHGLV